jgi:hypothetical protein
MMDEIKSLKSILNQKKPILHILLHPRHLKLFMLLTGISVSLFSLVFYFLEQRFGSFGTTPDIIRRGFATLVALVGIILFCLFFVFWSNSLKKSGGKFSGEQVWSSFFSFRVANLLMPVRVMAIIFILYCMQQNLLYYIIPLLSIAIGLQSNFLGCITETINYVIGGYWFMITGVYITLVPSIPGPLAVLLSLGCGCLLFGFLPNPEK